MTSAAARPASTRSQRVFGVVLGMLAVLVPSLVAGLRIGQAVADDERARLLEAVAAAEAPTQQAPLAARVLYTALAGDDVRARLLREPDRTMSQARLAMLVALVAVSGLLYVLVSTTRGGFTAVLTCLALAGLPAVVEDGCTLRPEPLACAFGLLGTLLLSAFAAVVMARRGRGMGSRVTVLILLMVFTGVAFGIASAAVPRASVLLLVPAGVVALACAVQTWTWVRVLRRRRIDRRMLGQLANRSWPWFGLAVFGMAGSTAALYLLAGLGVSSATPSGSSFGVLPPFGVRAVLVTFLLGLGGLRLVLESGGHLSARRVHPSHVTLLFAALALMHHFMDGAGLYALLPACAAAILIGEGAMTVIVVLVGAMVIRAQQKRKAAG